MTLLRAHMNTCACLQVMRVSVTHDARVVDGATAERLCGMLCRCLPMCVIILTYRDRRAQHVCRVSRCGRPSDPLLQIQIHGFNPIPPEYASRRHFLSLLSGAQLADHLSTPQRRSKTASKTQPSSSCDAKSAPRLRGTPSRHGELLGGCMHRCRARALPPPSPGHGRCGDDKHVETGWALYALLALCPCDESQACTRLALTLK